MKKISLLLVAFCAFLFVSCGNSAIEKINQLVVDATEQTMAATSAEEVAEIATTLQEEMGKIAAEAGDKLTFGVDVEEALAEYQAAAAAKLTEFGINLE